MNENNTQNVMPNVGSKSKLERNFPDLRFKTFTDCWSEIEISTLIKEINIKTSDFITYPLYSFTIEDGVTPKTDRYERGFLVKKDGELFKVIKKDYFIMNPMNLRFGAINFSKIINPVSVSGYYDIFTIDDCNYNYFWNAYFKNKKTLYRYNQIATGSLEEKKRVYFNQFMKMKFKVPSNDEKCKINNLISLIEDRIITQKKIIEKYESLIKSINDAHFCSINKFFKFSDLYIKAKEGGTPDTKKENYYLNGNIPFIKIDDLYSKYIQNNKTYITNEGLQNSSAWIIPENSVIYSNGATIGEVAINKYSITTKQGILGIIPNHLISTEYFYYLLKSKYFKKEICKITTKGTMDAAYIKDIDKILCPLINIDEQKSYCSKISKIYLKIELEKKILLLFEQKKQYLLNKLFI